MSNHVTQWLNAYHDGELRGSRLHSVEAHLAECEPCRKELESLESLSSLLHEVHTPQLVSTDRFAAQVNLRLPHKRVESTAKRKVVEIGWWMIPVGILAAWVFVSTALIVGDVVSLAGNLGLLSGLSSWLASAPSGGVYVSTTIGQMGMISGNGLNWMEAAETFTRGALPQITLQVSIALLYMSWMAIWWVRHTHQEHGQLQEN